MSGKVTKISAEYEFKYIQQFQQEVKAGTLTLQDLFDPKTPQVNYVVTLIQSAKPHLLEDLKRDIQRFTSQNPGEPLPALKSVGFGSQGFNSFKELSDILGDLNMKQYDLRRRPAVGRPYAGEKQDVQGIHDHYQRQNESLPATPFVNQSPTASSVRKIKLSRAKWQMMKNQIDGVGRKAGWLK